jgi:8-oxo-dGTP diphosphatase
MNGHYGLPSGKVEKNEPYVKAAIREAKEEAGVTISAKDLQYALTVHRYAGDNDMTWVDVYFIAKKWRGEAYNAEPDKHSKLAWLDKNNLPKNTIPSVVNALEQIKAGKTYSEFGW